MSQLLRIDTYALARPHGAGWISEWCVVSPDGEGGWRFGEGAGELLQPRRAESENNEYVENPGPRIRGKVSDIDRVYYQLREFLPRGEGPIDLMVSGAIGQPQAEEILGVLEALGYAPRSVLPTALLASLDLEPGRYGVIELGRSRSWISEISVHPDRAMLESTREHGDFGFHHLFTRWIESVAEAFATQHRFDIHRNLAANRGRLFGQMRQAFTERREQIQFSLDSRSVTLNARDFQTEWPKPAFDTEGLELLLLSPLALPLPGAGLPRCDDPAPEPIRELAGRLPTDGMIRYCRAFSF